MHKQRLLFVMNNLHCGGAEKALVSLLQTIDYSRFEVDLLLFRKEGLFLNQVPETVTILEAPQAYPYFDGSFIRSVGTAFLKLRWNIVWNRIRFSIAYKSESIPALREQKCWKFISATLPKQKGTYDVAIGFLEKTPNYYCIEKVEAKRKIGYIHNDYKALEMDPYFDLPYFKKFDSLVTVSEECQLVLQHVFPTISKKIVVISNILSTNNIINLAKEKVNIDRAVLTLISVGRLDTQKGYDIAIESCKLLVDQYQLKFKWYVLGEGELKDELVSKIEKYNLQDTFILLGAKENPYAYMSQADIFVHTARFEGFGIVIAEAKILKLPMVITNFNVAKSHIDHGENGFIAEMSSDSVAAHLQQLITDHTLRAAFSNKLSLINHGNETEIIKFYELINFKNNRNENN
jgi:glycosyltransferase involved in cell wall biosynthesis